MFISVSESISGIDKNIAYLQYGLIYREIPLSDYEKLIKELKIGAQTLRREGIGFVIDTYKLKECIEAKSNSPFWEKYKKRNVPDLKNPDHIELKRKIFKAFGLDADKTYEENLKNVGGKNNVFLRIFSFLLALSLLIDVSIFFQYFPLY